MYARSKTEADKAFYDWSTSVGLTWGVGFLLVQPFSGFFIAYSMKGTTGSYERLTGGDGGTLTSNLLYINLAMVVGLFVLSNVAMYIGAGRHPDRAGRRPIQFFGLVAALTGLYSISPLANFPFFHMRYIMILVMVLATLGAFITYVRGRMRFRYGSPGAGYRMILLALGVLAAVVALNMGWMKSNSRVPYTVYNQPEFTVENELPPSGFGR
jgi:cytochrome bd ubiquinol oxidase subunit I